MLYLLTALAAEARPLRDEYRLAARPDCGPFAHFVGDGVELVQTGIGKTAMAAGCGWLAARAFETPGLWLNVGIAGHRDLPLGSPLLAHQVLDRATGRTFYPPLVFAPPCSTGTVETVDRPELDYPLGHAYDMEASAFAEIAQKVAGAELAHVLKVVSDRCREDVANLDRAAVGARVETLLPLIEKLREAAEPLLEIQRAGGEEPEHFAALLAQAHFTWSDKNELRRLLRRRAALGAEVALPPELSALKRGRDLNRRLAAWLDRQPLHFGPAPVPAE